MATTASTPNVNSSKSLKSINMKWLVALATADLLVVTLFLVPGFDTGASLTTLGASRAATTAFLPVAILLIVNVLPNEVKSMLVYWKSLGWLPGCEAFTRFGPQDPRIDMRAIESKLGTLPTGFKEQNATWYGLFKEVENEPEVSEVHRHFLMYRDMAVMSLPFIALAPFVLYLAGATLSAQGAGVGLFALQYLVTAISGRWTGIRFVTNVLAVHSAKAPKSSRRPAGTARSPVRKEC